MNVCMNIDEAHFLGVLCVVMALEKNKFSSAVEWERRKRGGMWGGEEVCFIWRNGRFEFKKGFS